MQLVQPAEIDRAHGAGAGITTSHIFIVGLSRSGTSLVRAVLNASERIGIAGAESHFFDAPIRLASASRKGQRKTRSGPRNRLDDEELLRVVEHIYGADGNGFWARLARLVDRDEFERRLRASDRTDRALFDLAMEYFADGKSIRGEKTPRHVHSVPTLFEWFPDARVIHTLRDPRAVYVSLRRKERDWTEGALRPGRAGRVVRRLGPLTDAYFMTKLINDFRNVVRIHRRLQQRFGDHYLMLQFEELIRNSETTVRELCAFVGVEFADEMLEQVVRNSSFAPTGSSGFDASAVDRWRPHLSSLSRWWFALLCGREMTEFGYEL